MRILIQRVAHAKVDVEGKTVGSIGRGALVFFGAAQGDTPEKSAWLASKLVHLRMFEDDQEKMNRSLLDIQGGILIVSQFTLYADCSEGRRPSFTKAAPPREAEPLYHHFVQEVKKSLLPVETGVFRACMQVSLLNDGPVTFLIDSK